MATEIFSGGCLAGGLRVPTPKALQGVFCRLLRVILRILEEVLVGVFRGRTISQSIPAIGGESLQGLLSHGAIVFVAMIPFFAFREIGRVIGQRELWSLLLNRGTRVYTLQSRPQ
jgi:hypothetical protein